MKKSIIYTYAFWHTRTFQLGMLLVMLSSVCFTSCHSIMFTLSGEVTFRSRAAYRLSMLPVENTIFRWPKVHAWDRLWLSPKPASTWLWINVCPMEGLYLICLRTLNITSTCACFSMHDGHARRSTAEGTVGEENTVMWKHKRCAHQAMHAPLHSSLTLIRVHVQTQLSQLMG